MDHSPLWKCTESIIKLFLYDTVALLDRVLCDDPTDPQFSANTVCDRFSMVAQFRALQHSTAPEALDSMLQNAGYGSEDIRLLHQKCEEERARCPWLKKEHTA